MERRALIKNIALLSGGVFVGGSFLLEGCKNKHAGLSVLTKEELSFISDITQTIIPTTDTAGAKEANVTAFIEKVFKDIYTEKQQQKFLVGLKMVEQQAKSQYQKKFAQLSPAEKLNLLNDINQNKDKYEKLVLSQENNFDNSDTATNQSQKKIENINGFEMLTQLTIYGYISSEKGMQASFRYTPIPGKYVGEIDYKKGDKAFVGLNLFN